MQGDPILSTHEYRDEHGARLRLTVYGGLRYIRGNARPYFSLTADLDEFRSGKWREYSGGTLHDEILRHRPDLADLAALHGSYDTGEPMHAEANGWYWLAGALGGMGERYHGGNSEGHYGGKYRTPDRTECLAVFAKHIRVDTATARTIAADVSAARDPRQHWVEWCKTQGPRWVQEAAECTARHGLKVFGDPLPEGVGR